jgi:hypothetical protein
LLGSGRGFDKKYQTDPSLETCLEKYSGTPNFFFFKQLQFFIDDHVSQNTILERGGTPQVKVDRCFSAPAFFLENSKNIHFCVLC